VEAIIAHGSLVSNDYGFLVTEHQLLAAGVRVQEECA